MNKPPGTKFTKSHLAALEKKALAVTTVAGAEALADTLAKDHEHVASASYSPRTKSIAVKLHPAPNVGALGFPLRTSV
jgi:hypothetical protein